MKVHRLLIFMILLKSISLYTMEPMSQPAHKAFQFTPSAEALELIKAAQTLSLEEAVRLYQNGTQQDKLKARFVGLWYIFNQRRNGETNELEFRAGLLDFSMLLECRYLEAFLTLASTENGYSTVCRDIFFHAASEKGWLPVVRFFCENGYDTCYRIGALHDAAYWTRSDVVEYLLENGVEINRVYRDGTALDRAYECEKSLQMLLPEPCFEKELTRNHALIRFLIARGAHKSSDLASNKEL